MTRSLRVDVAAGDELEAAIEWYDARRRGLGLDLRTIVDATLADIASSPRSGTPMPIGASSLVVRRRVVTRFPYSIVYVELGEEIRVLAFAHGRRRPGYWRHR